MKCEYVKNNLYNFFKKELSYEEMNKIKKHIKKCKECQKEFQKIKKIHKLIINEINTPPENILKNIKTKINIKEPFYKKIFSLKPAIVFVSIVLFFAFFILFFNNIKQNNYEQLETFIYDTYSTLYINNSDDNYYTSFDLDNADSTSSEIF